MIRTDRIESRFKLQRLEHRRKIAVRIRDDIDHSPCAVDQYSNTDALERGRSSLMQIGDMSGQRNRIAVGDHGDIRLHGGVIRSGDREVARRTFVVVLDPFFQELIDVGHHDNVEGSQHLGSLEVPRPRISLANTQRSRHRHRT